MHGSMPGASFSPEGRAEAPQDKSREAKGAISPFGPRHLPRFSRALVSLVSLVTSLLLFALAGCSDSVQVTDRTQSSVGGGRGQSVTDAPKTGESHDLAIAAVDFDPALNTRRSASSEPVALLIAVENRGNRTEGRFNVSAQLYTQDRARLLKSASQSVATLAAGDISVVRFPITEISIQPRTYILEVQVAAVPGEANTANNRRTLEIRVSGQ
jgi:hypothetical protein